MELKTPAATSSMKLANTYHKTTLFSIMILHSLPAIYIDTTESGFLNVTLPFDE